MLDAQWFLCSWYACDDFLPPATFAKVRFWRDFVSVVSPFMVVAFGVPRSRHFPVR